MVGSVGHRRSVTETDGTVKRTASAQLASLERRVVACTRCPELRSYCAEVGRVKRRAYRDHDYWARPVAGFGDPTARLVVIGLAPGAHGSNRTGRPFTGDSSGDWLYRALHRAGFANQPHSVDRSDGLQLHDCWVTGAVRCAPPDNKPTPAQRDACAPYLSEELAALHGARVIVTLGRFADDAVGAIVGERVPFAHLAESHADLPGAHRVTVLRSYHPSRQNTQTKVLTEAMFDAVFVRARKILDG
jgi:uracil-DNA glycosylase family 4